MTDPVSTSDPVAKADPETLVLRAQPRRVVRFKRHVLIASAAVGSVALAGIAWLGLGASPPKIVAQKELFNPDKVAEQQMARPDNLIELPQTYADIPGDVPVLGPPLPGDLGGAIHAQQQTQVKPVEAGRAVEPGRAASGVFFQTTPRLIHAVEIGGPKATSALEALTAPLPTTPPEALNAPAPVAFVDRKGLGGIYNSHVLETPRSPSQIMAGTVISASLLTGLKSDLPGFVIAQVTQPVFDYTGRYLLIPQGTRLLGQYDDQVAFGQSRALVVWKRLIRPDGTSLEIDNLPATDPQGYAGLADRVDYHTWRLLKGVGLSTLLGFAAHDVGDDDGDLVQAFRESTRDTANQAGQRIVEKTLAIQPSITVRPGWPVRVIVHKDLILNPYYGAGTNG